LGGENALVGDYYVGRRGKPKKFLGRKKVHGQKRGKREGKSSYQEGEPVERLRRVKRQEKEEL